MNGQMHFFKKSIPHTDVVMSNHQALKFTTFDSETGYFAANNDFVVGELKKCIEEQRYGVSEISAEEFERDYIQKKSSGLTPARPPQSWERERIGSKGYESPTHPVPKSVAPTVDKSVVVADKAKSELRMEDPPIETAAATVPAITPRGPAPTPALGSRSRPPIKPI